ncbi:Protein STRUBBELIG-REPTOR FAMILY 8 [Trifolium repens]|nr:Protein STRUBBELIG-REPTOR FAMILY 8 [Trifolium repens]
MAHTLFLFLTSFSLILSFFLHLSLANTDPSDVQALEVMYNALNNPTDLKGWKIGGGDPCGDSWKGITCEGSSVVSIDLSGLGLHGTLGYLLSDLRSLRKLDLSGNKIHDQIPYQLPPNLTSLNLAGNNLTGNLPYSIAIMVSLNYLNVSNNALSMSIGDIFANHSRLDTLDLSFNNFSGDLPPSFGSLSNLSSLFLQKNQLTGSLSVLAGLPLDNLNVANNNFSGWIPRELKSINNFIYDGNSFNDGPAPPSPESTPSPPSEPHKGSHHSGSGSHTKTPGSEDKNSDGDKGTSAGAIVGIVLGSVLVFSVILVALVFCIRKLKGKEKGARTSNGSVPPGIINVTPQMQEQRVKSAAVITDLKPRPPAENVTMDRMAIKSGSVKQMRSPITSTSYTVATLQSATNSFSQEFIIGEGSLGRVYRAEFPNGKVMAVKKIDNAALSLQEEDNFLEAISNMSRLRHPNVVTLAGYCAEHGQRLLIYEYIGNGNLHDMLHFAEDSSKALPWNARVRIALGTARALEYLHEVCLPSVVHRNFKSANILLDEELNPHLSDCGLASLTPNTERQVSSTQMVGSFGYSAPEFALSGVYTVKSDVYSFGVVMLELLTGRKPLDSSRVRAEQSLVRWATPQLHDIDALSKMVDPCLNGMYPAKSLSRFADIIALCVQPEPEFRPPMSEVVQALVRLVQRASVVKRRPSDESGFFGHKTPDHESMDMSF